VIIGFHYRRSQTRRGSRSSTSEHADRRLVAREVDAGAWRVTPGGAEAAAAAEEPQSPEEIETAPAAATVDRQRLAAAGYLDPGSGRPLLAEQLRPIGRALTARAFAPNAGRRDRLILVSSAGVGEGKSLTAVNLALALTHDEGQAVLLVDGDPRTAGSARALGLLPEPGLTDTLRDVALDPLVSPTGLDGLSFLAPGRPWAAMTRALASRRMAQLVGELLARDPEGLVVIDGPPLLAGTAGAALAMFAGQVVLVVAAGRSSEPAIDASLKRLGEREKVGFVLTRAGAPAVASNGRGAHPQTADADRSGCGFGRRRSTAAALAEPRKPVAGSGPGEPNSSGTRPLSSDYGRSSSPAGGVIVSPGRGTCNRLPWPRVASITGEP
jgi:protein-tyrosine kinase